MVVQAGRLKRYEIKGLFLMPRCDVDIFPRESRVSEPMLPRKAACGAKYQLVPETDTGGWGEYPKALERTQSKELCKLAP